MLTTLSDFIQPSSVLFSINIEPNILLGYNGLCIQGDTLLAQIHHTVVPEIERTIYIRFGV